MKNKLNPILILSALAASVLTGAVPAKYLEPNPDLIDTAMSVHQFDTFLMLVRDADLTFKLKDDGPYTIFMPTDEAFAKMPDGLLKRIHGNKSRLRQFLLHHIVPGSFAAEKAVQAHSLNALDGSKLIMRNVDGHGMVANSRFSITNIRACNGIMHGMDNVLMSK